MQFRRKNKLAFLFVFLSFSAISGTFKITRLNSRTEVIAEISHDDDVKNNDLVVITGEKDKVIAVGHIRDINKDDSPPNIKVELSEDPWYDVEENSAPTIRTWIQAHNDTVTNDSNEKSPYIVASLSSPQT